jgi:hypothetical protein
MQREKKRRSKVVELFNLHLFLKNFNRNLNVYSLLLSCTAFLLLIAHQFPWPTAASPPCPPLSSSQHFQAF